MKNIITALVAVFAFTLPHSAKSSGHEEVEAIADAFAQAAEGSTAFGLTYYDKGDYESDRFSGAASDESGVGFFMSASGIAELGLARFGEDTTARIGTEQSTVLYLSVLPRVNLGKGKIKKWGKHISLFGRLGTHLTQTDVEIAGANPSDHTNYDADWHYGYGAEVVFGSDPENSPFRLRLERTIYNFGEWETDYTRGGESFTLTTFEHKRTYTGLSLVFAWGPWLEY